MAAMEKQEQYALPQVRLALALALSKARGTKSSDAAIVSALEAKAELLKNEVVVLGQKVKEAEENVKELLLHVPSKRQCFQNYSEPNSFNANLALSYDSAVTNNALRHILRCASPAEKSHKIIIAADFIFELIGGSESGAKGQCSQSLLCQSVEFLKDCVVFLLQESNNGVVLAERITKRILMLTTKKVLSFSSPQDLNGVFSSDHASLQHILFQLSYVPFIGQRLLLIASQQIAVVSEMVSHVDPFEDEKVTNTYENVFFMLQLLETMCIKHVSKWAAGNQLDFSLLGDWVQCYFQMKETHSNVLGSWNLLFINYTDQIAGEIFKQLHSLSSLEEHLQDTLHKKVINLMRLDFEKSKITWPKV